MALDNIHEELSLWEQLEFSEGHLWKPGTRGNQDYQGGLLLEDSSFWSTNNFPKKSFGNVSLGIDERNLYNDEDSLADWLDERIDVAEINEMVNSPEFNAVLMELSNDSSSTTLNDIDVLPIQTSDFFSSSHDVAPVEIVDVSATESSIIDDFLCNIENVLVTNDTSFIVDQSSLNSTNFDDSSSSNSPADSFSPYSTPPCSPTSPVTSSQDGPNSPSVSRHKRQRPRSNPYANSNDKVCALGDGKVRKRCQNKTAASRYRNKKRAEFDTLSEEESKLLDTNKDLKTKTTQLETEVSYLKGLMKEILIAKGLIKK